MAIELDHIILSVNDRARSLKFYTEIVGLDHDRQGDREPFSMLRVTPGFVIQMAQWGTKGGEHLAFAMSKQRNDAIPFPERGRLACMGGHIVNDPTRVARVLGDAHVQFVIEPFHREHDTTA